MDGFEAMSQQLGEGIRIGKEDGEDFVAKERLMDGGVEMNGQAQADADGQDPGCPSGFFLTHVALL